MCIQGRGGDTGSKCLGTSVVSQIEHLCGRLELGRRWVCGRITSWAAVRIGQWYNIAGCGDEVAFDTVNPKLPTAILLLFLRSSISTESTLKVKKTLIGIIQVSVDGLSFLFLVKLYYIQGIKCWAKEYYVQVIKFWVKKYC